MSYFGQDDTEDVVLPSGMVEDLKCAAEFSVYYMKHEIPGATGTIPDGMFEEQAQLTLDQLECSRVESPYHPVPRDWRNLAGLVAMYADLIDRSTADSTEKLHRMLGVLGDFGWGELDWEYATDTEKWGFLMDGYRTALVEEARWKSEVASWEVP